MKQLHHYITPILFFTVLSCNRNDNYIIETNTDALFEKATKNGLTEHESEKLGESIYDSIIDNTIGKSFPDVTVTNLTNKEINLANELNGYTIIISSDIHCGYGEECLTKTFPNSIKKILSEKIHTICLVKKTEEDSLNPEIFNKFIQELNPLYETVYIIEELESKKLNLYANPTRLYINNQKIVSYIAFGVPIVGDLYDEIRLNLKYK